MKARGEESLCEKQGIVVREGSKTVAIQSNDEFTENGV
eukprot:CAMPEP_0176443896 /NCGR_PEP_ID=MMETSP0127-20121128/22719_1 /TAXON_ID=938130 /ORGANISM="Platyophrya macrostoma, Strain WH" /LENGTH=37 /DNA_ID= /DNA_START= /DNA_END= /DNA_ORIENTATION=